MQKLAPSRETSLMRLSIRAGACLDTPIHNPTPATDCSPSVLQGQCPQVKVTCGKSALSPLWVYTEFPTHCVISLMEKVENFEMYEGYHVKITFLLFRLVTG